MSHTLVSVVIVTFESADDIEACVRSVLASAVPVEIIVVDNASSDGTVDSVVRIMADHPECRVICNTSNRGFAKAVNQGLEAGRGEYALLLNPDCIPDHDAIARALVAMEAAPGAAVAGCMLLNANGTEQAGGRRYLPTPWRALVRVLKLHGLAGAVPGFDGMQMNLQPTPSQPVEIEATSGAFMLVRRAAMQQVGTLDEGYFMHCEDLDWCCRFRQAGWTVLFVPHARVVHKKGRSSSRRPIRVELYKHLGMIRFYRKFLRDRYPAVLTWGVLIAVWMRFAVISTFLIFCKARSLRTPLPQRGLDASRRHFG